MNKIVYRWFASLLVIGLIIWVADVDSTENKAELEKSSRYFAETNLPGIIDGWQLSELSKLASEPLLQAIRKNPEKFEKMFDRYKSLGRIKSLGAYDGGITQQTSHSGVKAIFAIYKVNYQFEQDNARITMQLVQENGQWRILGIDIKLKK